MKYLIFNAAVVAALGYIFLGDGTFNMNEVTEPVSRTIDQIVKAEPVKAEPVTERAPQPVKAVREELSDEEKFILYGKKAAVKTPAKQPKKIVKPGLPKTEVAQIQVPPLPAAIEVQKKAALPPTTQSEPLHQSVDKTETTDSAPEVSAPSPVDQAERRKNLRRLVADMERVFAEKLTQ